MQPERHATAPGDTARTDHVGDLTGRPVLVLEDDALIALMIAEAVLEVGGVPITARSAAAAGVALDRLAGQGGPAGAVLDLDLGDHTSQAVARRLQDAGVPVVFYTGGGRQGVAIPSDLDAPVVLKPAPPEEVMAVLLRLMEA